VIVLFADETAGMPSCLNEGMNELIHNSWPIVPALTTQWIAKVEEDL